MKAENTVEARTVVHTIATTKNCQIFYMSASQFNLKFERIFMTLRRGGSVMIRDAKGQAAMSEREFADIAPERMEDMAKGSEILCLTKRHITAFGRAVPNKLNCFTLTANIFDKGQITTLILGDGTLLPADANILGERENSLPDIACQLLRAVRLIPAALLSYVSVKDQLRQARLAENFQIPILDLHELANLTKDTEPDMDISTQPHCPWLRLLMQKL